MNEILKQRAFILSSFTRMKMTITTNIYEFTDETIKKGWSPRLDDLNKVDEEILEQYLLFIKNK
jgi:hypothetical protein